MKKINAKDIIIPAVALLLICLVATTLLALTNNVTAGKISENSVQKENTSRTVVLPQAKEFSEVAELENGVSYFSVASGGGTGRTLHPDNMAAGPSSYGMTDTMGRMHSDAQFAGSSSVPAHVEMMGLIGMGNNPMVGATVACAVAVEEAMK